MKKHMQYLLFALAVILLSGCGKTYIHKDKDQLDFLSRIETQRDGDVEVSAVALGADETTELFGVEAAEEGIQPVWLRVRNNDTVSYWLFPVTLDPEYYAPHEASWINHFSFSGSANREMDDHFRRNQIHLFVKPGHTVSGFVYTRLDEGKKAIAVDLKSPGSEDKNFLFALPVPGIELDRDEVDLDQIYTEDQITDIDNLEDFRTWIEQLPCCVFGEDGVTPGDPLNLVLVGSEENVSAAFIQQNWHVTEKLNLETIWKTVTAFMSGSKYRYSPVSPLYVFGRKQDWAVQKARETIDERNHLRLWLAPARFQGEPIWVGQISRDIGVRMTGKIWPLTTHVIDPEVDEARYYLAQDLMVSKRIYKGGLAKGVGAAFPDDPRHNLLGDPYYTDGLRLVFFFSDQPKFFNEIEFIRWEIPPNMIHMQASDED